jgi:hypothetical protein
MRIEDNIGIFTISVKDPDSMQTYIGEFKVKLILDPLELLAIDRDFRELIGPVSPLMAGQEANNIAFALSQLKHRVIHAPAFWKGYGYDGGHLPKEVLYAVLDDSLKVQEKFKKQKLDEQEALVKKLTAQVRKGAIKKTAPEETPASDEDQDDEGSTKL